MATFFEGVGRAKPVSELVASALGVGRLLEGQRRTGVAEDRTAIMEQNAAQARQLTAMQMKQLQRQEAHATERIDPRNTVAWLSLSKEEQKKFEPFINQIAPQGTLTERYKVHEATRALTQRPEFQQATQDLVLEAQKSLQTAYNNLQENPSTENQKKYNNAMKHVAAMQGKWSQKTPTADKGQWEDFSDPRFPGQLLQRHTVTGQVRKATGSPKGLRVTTDAEGRTTVETNVSTGLQRKTIGDLEGKIAGGIEALGRMQSIHDQWAGHPEYNDLGFRLDQKVKEVGEKVFRKQLTPDEKTELTNYTKARSAALADVNEEIKRITGAQMSEREAKRLRLPLPDPGEGLWPKQSHTVFMGNLDRATRAARASIMRWNFMLSKGYTPQAINEMVKSGDIDKLIGHKLEDLMENLQ